MCIWPQEYGNIRSNIAIVHYLSLYHHKHQTSLNITQMYWSSILITALSGVFGVLLVVTENTCLHHHYLLVSFKIYMFTHYWRYHDFRIRGVWQKDDNLVTMVISLHFSYVEVVFHQLCQAENMIQLRKTIRCIHKMHLFYILSGQGKLLSDI